jgi:hypothetical protein
MGVVKKTEDDYDSAMESQENSQKPYECPTATAKK